MENELKLQPPNGGASHTLHERQLASRLAGDAIELARRIHHIDLVFDDPVSIKHSSAITLDDYQKSALLTANRRNRKRDQIMNAALGIGGEAGEVIEALAQAALLLGSKSGKVLDDIKKYFFHTWSDMYVDNQGSRDIVRNKVRDELGDMLWYIADLAHLFDFTLGDIAKRNRQKLIERHGAGADTKPKEESPDYDNDDDVVIKETYKDGSNRTLLVWNEDVKALRNRKV